MPLAGFGLIFIENNFWRSLKAHFIIVFINNLYTKIGNRNSIPVVGQLAWYFTSSIAISLWYERPITPSNTT